MESFKMFVPKTDVDSVERHNQLLDNIILHNSLLPYFHTSCGRVKLKHIYNRYPVLFSSNVTFLEEFLTLDCHDSLPHVTILMISCK